MFIKPLKPYKGRMIGEVESVDEVEIIRRMTEGIYDKAEYKKALA